MTQYPAVVTLALALGCGGASPFVNHIEDPQPHSGGGLGSGAIAGELNVFVIDADTGAAVEGAEVRVGAADVKEPLIAPTDSDGYALFESGTLSGPQVITVVATGYAASTWFGVGGAVVTIPMEPSEPKDVVSEAPPSATVLGTIEGWEDLPDPPGGFGLAALITYTRIGATVDGIEQEPHPDLSGLLPNLTANTCLRVQQPPILDYDDCNWTLHTRTGPQVLYAIIALLDLNALSSGNVGAGDFEILGYASAVDLDLSEDDFLTDQLLQMIDGADLVDTTISVDDLPEGLDLVVRSSTLDLGEPGRALFPPVELTLLLPTLDAETVPLPEATGKWDGTYTMQGSALEEGGASLPASRIVYRDAELGEIDLGEWLALPGELTADPILGTYSFERVAGASVHDVSIDDTDGTRAWNVLILEPPVEEAPDAGVQGPIVAFTLPLLDPDPLPSGNVHLTVRASQVPGFDPLEFAEFSSGVDGAPRQSEDRKRFSR